MPARRPSLKRRSHGHGSKRRRRRRLLLALLALAALAVAAVGVRAALQEDAAPDNPPPPFMSSLPGRDVTLWAVGDSADGGRAARAVARLIASRRVDGLLYLGDVYETGTLEEFERNYEPLFGRLAPVTAPTPGNHEWGNHDRGYDVWWEEQKGREPPLNYTFTAAGWRILSLNSETGGGRAEQVRWLRDQVDRPGNCRIAFWHTARYSAGVEHPDDPRMAPFWNALRGRATIVLSGHDHNMQRLAPVDGITQFISGAGGKRLYDLRPTRGSRSAAQPPMARCGSGSPRGARSTPS